MIRQIRIQPQRALIWGALLLVGAGLITISYLAPDRYEAMVPTIAAEARPSATWAPLPTRALNDASTLAVDPDLGVLHRAILSGDLRAAEVMWEALQDAGLGQTAEIQVAGARIALLQGDTVTAESRVWEAIGLEPTNAEIWSLLGVISRTAGDTKGADEALSIAVGLEPSLSGDLFADRWALAAAQGATDQLVALAETYAVLHPDGQAGPYFRSTALLAIGEPLEAIELLVGTLEQTPDSPALIWYALGEAYLQRKGYAEAATAFEVAAALLARGDTSLLSVSEDPVSDLSSRLARAYVHTERCAEAEDIARRLLSTQPELEALVEQAVICQTPTPTLTPWIPVQQQP